MRKGLLIVFTGEGKGKTTAALGMAMRAVGHGMRVLILQFIKGAWKYGELEALKRFPEIRIKPLGSGFTWNKENMEEDRALAQKGWQEAATQFKGNQYDMIVFDELNYVLHYGLLPLAQILADIAARPPQLHVVVTGRNAPQPLIDAADLVTEMRLVKHPYREQGVKAQQGIEF